VTRIGELGTLAVTSNHAASVVTASIVPSSPILVLRNFGSYKSHTS
jgi:hypothetical protein